MSRQFGVSMPLWRGSKHCSLLDLAEREADTSMLGCTHLQAAQPAPTRIRRAGLLGVFDIDLEHCRIRAGPPGHRPEHRRRPSIDSNWADSPPIPDPIRFNL
jgi:hypothetical protein